MAILKAEYAAAAVAPFSELLTKLSLLFLYNRIFGVRRSYSLWIKFFGLVQTAEAVAAQLVGPWVAGVESVNSFVDFGMTILAMIMIHDLNLRTSTKWKLSGVFVLGAFTGIIGLIKIFLSYNAAINNQLTRGVWSTAQWGVSIICSCVVVFKPILPSATRFTRLFSKLSSYGSKIKLANKPSITRLYRGSQKSHDAVEIVQPRGNAFGSTENIIMDAYSTPATKRDYATHGVAI